MIPIIILVVSFILDGILSNFIPVINLSLFTPLLTVTSVFLIYQFYKKHEVKYFIIIAIAGILYDLFYTNLLFFNMIIFLLVGYLSKIIYKNFELSPFKLIIYLIAIISIYEISTALIILVFNLVPVTISRIIYKITHSLLLNIIYAEIIYLIIKLIPKKYKKININ